MAGLALAADVFQRGLGRGAGDRRVGEHVVEAAAQVGRVLGKAFVFAQVAERGFDVIRHHPQRLQVRQGVGGGAAVLLDVARQGGDMGGHHLHHAVGVVVLACIQGAQRHYRGDDAHGEADQEQEEIARRGVAAGGGTGPRRRGRVG